MNTCFNWKTNDQYATPKNIYNHFINNGYVDFNPLCVEYENSLVKDFSCNLFCNPPYSNIMPFVDYMINHAKKGYYVIMLLPVRTGSKWFKKLCDYGCIIDFFTQRLHFNEGASAPFDCMLVHLFQHAYDTHGLVNFHFIDRNLNRIY